MLGMTRNYVAKASPQVAKHCRWLKPPVANIDPPQQRALALCYSK